MTTVAPSQPLKRIPILRVGSFTSMEGRVVSFTRDNLADIADAYNAECDPAPIVLGHPDADDPAFGRIGGVELDGDVLFAVPSRVAPELVEANRKGQYTRVSARLFTPNSAGNPVPGKFYLRHVGMLGAAAPGIHGLGEVSFASDLQADCISFSFPLNQEDPIMTDTTTAAPAAENDAVSFAAREEALSQREAAIAAREAAIAQQLADERHATNVSFAASLVDQAKLKPADKEALVSALDAVGSIEGAVSFAAGDGATVEQSPADIVKRVLMGAASVVPLGEVATASNAPAAASASFAAPQGYTVLPNDSAIYAKAKALQADNPKLSIIDAVKLAQA